MAHKIGLEIHLQLKTKTKLFCGCPSSASEPNTAVCPTCLGMPGAKPRTNSAAVKQAMQLAFALNCKLSSHARFARKTYFYPDLPKNYQVTQFEEAIATDGALTVNGKDIPITRIQLEEDPASLKHAKDGVLIDYNRAGTPLCEIVTPPVFESPAEARLFLEALMRLAEYIDIFDPQVCKIRADVNVSVTGHPRAEVKNVTSFRDVERAAAYEIIRQETLVEQGIKGIADTRSFEAKSGTTDSMRTKETEEEYGYVPDPDLVPLEQSSSQLKLLKDTMPETPLKREQRLMKQFGLQQKQAEALISERAIVDQYEQVIKHADPLLAATWYGYVQKVINFNSVRFASTGVTKEQMVAFIKLIADSKVSKRGAELLLRELVVKPQDPAALAQKMGVLLLSTEETEKLIKEVIASNAKAVEEFRSGKEKALQFLVGQVIRLSKGRADELKTLERLKRLLK